jgi:hypothetical protein
MLDMQVILRTLPEDSCAGAVITGVDCDIGRYVEWVAR